jgi:hypothetical protein
MGQFVASTYEVSTLGGRVIKAILFKSADEIKEFVGSCPFGMYRVFREFPRGRGERESELWGFVENRRSGDVVYHPRLPYLVAETVEES